MRIEFTLRISQAALGSGYASSQVNNLPLAIHFSRLRCNGPQVVDLVLTNRFCYSVRHESRYRQDVPSSSTC
jgi:hypothetical protein